MNNPVGWFEIYVQDMPRARRFYETVLGRNLSSLASPDNSDDGLEMWSFASDQTSYGAPGALVKMPGFGSGGNSVIIYFSSQDCAVEAARVAAAGGKVHQEKMSIGAYGFIALCLDTEGNMFGLHSMS